MAISGKVSAASVGAAISTVVADIVGRHVFHGHAVPADLLALVGASVTAAVTFGCGFLAKHVPAELVTDVERVADMTIAQWAPTAEAPVADAPVADVVAPVGG